MTPNKIRAPNKVKLVAVLDVLKYKNLASASCTSESKSSAKAVAQRPRKTTNKAVFIFVFVWCGVTYKERTILLYMLFISSTKTESSFRVMILSLRVYNQVRDLTSQKRTNSFKPLVIKLEIFSTICTNEVHGWTIVYYITLCAFYSIIYFIAYFFVHKHFSLYSV